MCVCTYVRVHERALRRCCSTDVGKTIISGGLCRAALAASYRVCYIKPVQTGSRKSLTNAANTRNAISGRELDEFFVREYTNPLVSMP
jgi:dethiobiotin synthetase